MAKKYKSVQQYLDIAEIRDDIVIMKNGTIRAILMVGSINFALKNEDEQNAIISSYVSFLNNINFPLQIVVQSRRFNIEKYIKSLKEKEKEQTNELLKKQISEYIVYIQELIEIGHIMNKKFYLSIPYNPLSDTHKTFVDSIKEVLSPIKLVKMNKKRFNRYKKEIDRRVNTIISALTSIGLNTVQVDTQGLIELFYNTYNPITSEQEKVNALEDLRVEK